MSNEIKSEDTDDTIKSLQLQIKKLNRVISVQEKRITRAESVMSTRDKVMDMLRAERLVQENKLIRVHEENERRLALLNAVVRATKIALWEVGVVDNDLFHSDNTFTWSDEFRKMLGYSNTDDFPNILDSWKNCLHPDDAEVAIDDVVKHLSDETGQTPYDVEYRLMKKDGEYSYFRAYGESIRDEKGHTIRFAGALMDVTDQKRMAEEIKTALVKAQEANSNLQTILDMLPIGVRVMRMKDGALIYANKASLKVFNCSSFEDQVAGHTGFKFMPEIQPDGRKTADLVAEFFQHDTADIEMQCLKLDGEPFIARIKSCIVDYQGEPSSLASIEDVTAEIKKQQMLQNIAEKEREANQSKSNFLANMSHEIRTPMNAIIGMTAIGKKANDIEQKNYSLNKIGDASSHLLGVINDVLDMAKIEANKLELAPIEYNFELMLQKVLTVVNFRVDEKKQRLNLNIDKNIPRFINGDDQRLAQIITNLLSNAIKFTPEGGEIRLNASLVREIDGSCELRIEVIDSGIGISDEQKDRLFLAFEQAETGTNRQYGGTGLGLAISKRIIELMDGSIWVESELGKGAQFIFTIKTQRSDKSPSSMLAPGINWNNVRIMAVDDMKETRDQIQEIFEQLNINCDVAADGFEACRLIEERGAYDIYFVDWRMPGMDGIELTRKIKASSPNKPSVVIMITAMDWEQIKEDAFQAGVSKCLLKPLLSSMIIDCVNESLGLAGSINNDNAVSIGEFKGRKLLIAEDIEINREILIALLADTGLTIDCAENGAEALEMIEAAPDKYDIVFMDIQMPVMNGHEATRRIRAFEAKQQGKSEHPKGVPIIAMTANVFKSDIEECLAAGMDDHLGKPLDIDKVIEKLRTYLN